MTDTRRSKPRWLDDAWVPLNTALFPVGSVVQIRAEHFGDVIGYGESDYGPTLQVQFDNEPAPKYFALNFPRLNETLSVVHKVPERLPGCQHRLVVPDNTPFAVPPALGLGDTVDSYTHAQRTTYWLRACPDIAWVQRVLANATAVFDVAVDFGALRLSQEAEATKLFVRKTTDLVEVVTLQRFAGRWAWLDSDDIVRGVEMAVLNAEPDDFYGDSFMTGKMTEGPIEAMHWCDPLWLTHADGYDAKGTTRVSMYAEASIRHAPPRRPLDEQRTDFVEFAFGNHASFFRAHAKEVTTIERAGRELWRVLVAVTALDIDQSSAVGEVSVPLYCPKAYGPSWLEVGDEIEGRCAWMGTLASVWHA